MNKPIVWVAIFLLLAVACAEDRGGDDPNGTGDASSIVDNGDGYTFRRVTGKATELVIERGFGEAALGEVVSVIARKGGQPVGPVDVMVLNEPITPQEWVDEFYGDLMHQDVSDDVGAEAIVFTGAAIGVVMECRTEPDHVLIRGAGTHRDPLVELMAVLTERCS